MPNQTVESGIRILVVDDDATMAADLEYRLKKLGYTACDRAADADSALKMVVELQPDLVVVGPVLRGGLDALEVAALIRHGWGIPALLSAPADTDHLELLRHHHPFTHIATPCRDDDLGFRVELSLYLGRIESERRGFEQGLQSRTRELTERVKELNCLYGISRLVEKPEVTLDETLRGIADIIPAAWQYPEITCAEIVYKDKRYQTRLCQGRNTPWKLTNDIMVQGAKVGVFSVMYLDERPLADHGPFLYEEKSLGYVIAERLAGIIERYHNHSLLKSSAEKFRGIVQDLPGFICTFNDNFLIKFVNDNYCREFDKTQDELIGITFLNMIPESDREAVMANITALTPESPVQTHDHQVHTPGGRIKWQRWTNRAIYDQDGNLIEYQSVGADITEIKHAEEIKNKAYDELEMRVKERTRDLVETNARLLREIDERKKIETELKKSSDEIKFFAYSVLHDLKNPAISTYGITKLLVKHGRDVLDEKGLTYCDQILKSIEHLASLLEMVNLYIATKESSLVVETFKLGEVLSTIKNEFMVKINERRIKWSEPDHLPTVKADRIALVRVFRNLVDNALKYGGDGLTSIEVGYSDTAKFHTISISDNGKGIQAGDSRDIFELFKRNTVNEKVEGSGIGLAVVQEIIKQHQGSVWFESEEHKGTSFFVSIPKELPLTNLR